MAGLLGLVWSHPAGARDHTRKAGPAGNPGAWFNDDDYPADAKRAGAQGRVQIEVSIDSTGKPVGCRIVQSSGSSSLDGRTCELAIARGRFTPELDARGAAIPSSYTLSTRWVLRDPPLAKLDGPWRAAGELRIDNAGTIFSCVEKDTGPIPPWMHGPCPGVATSIPAVAALGLRGGRAGPTPIVTLESSLSFDNAAGPPMAFELPGSTVISAYVAHFDVTPEGVMQNCIVARVVGRPVRDLCAQPPLAFQPSAGPTRGVAFKIAISRKVDK